MPSRIAFSRSSSANGFVRNSSAPALIARTDVGMSPWPVRKMIGIWISALASSRCRSSPFNPGRCTSRTRQLATSARGLARNSCADSNVRTRNPDIEYEAVGALRVLRTREVVGGRECLHIQPDRADQAAQRFADRLIVIHNRNQRDWGHGRKVGGFSPLIYYIFI